MRLESTKITYRLAFAGIVSAITVLFIVIIMLSGLAYMSLKNAYIQESHREVSILAAGLSNNIASNGTLDESSIKAAISIDHTIGNVVVKNIAGEVLYFYSKQNEHLSSLRGLFDTQSNDYSIDLHNFYINMPLMNNGHTVGALYLSKSSEPLQQGILVYAVVAIIIFAVSIMVSWFMIERVKRSIEITEIRLFEMAHLDSVTNLFNRHAFNEKLQNFIESSKLVDEVFAVALLDLDDFKVINDTLGHSVGDKLLKIVGDVLVSSVRQGDIVARIGGDEFALILRGISSHADFEKVGQHILHQMALPRLINGRNIYISCSLGGALYPSDGQDTSTLLQHADLAMYAAKHKGKNCLRVFDAVLETQSHRKSNISTSLRKGLERNEFKLVYQPQFNLKSERIVGVEALLRWHSEEHGIISPDEFIRIAEDSGQMHALGEWILTKALTDVQEWNKHLKYEVPVAINISTTQLQKGNIEDVIMKISEGHNFPMYLLELEITESALMENVHAHIETFKKLQKHGIGLSIDDFGTGYSSMSYLQRLPLDTLKIDKSFVRDIATSKHDISIAKAIIGLAHILSLKVVAEGVETEAQAACLKDAECDIVQGYLYAKPMSLQELTVFLKTQEELLEN